MLLLRKMPSLLPGRRATLLTVVVTIILLGGFALRLWFSPHRGSPGDLNINQNWMRSAATFGFVESFRTQVDGNMWPNHGPVAIGLFAITEQAYRTVVSSSEEVVQPVHMIYSKLPAISFDLLLALLLFLIMARLYDRKAGLIAAGIVAVHPVLILESALWGQTDVIYSFFVLLSLFLVTRPTALPAGLGGVAYALAVLQKPHALIFAPLLLFILLPKWRSLMLCAGAGLLTAGITLLPFYLAGHPESVMRIYLNAPNEAWRLSWRAYNAWWMLFGDNAWERNGLEAFFFGRSYRTIGLALFGASYAYILTVMRRRLWNGERFVPSTMAAAAVALSFFLWNAGMHERYLFSVAVVGLPMLWAGTRLRTLYVWITALHYANLAVVLPLISVENRLLALFPVLPVFIATQLVVAFFLLMHALWTDGKDALTERLRPRFVAALLRSARKA